MSCQSCIYWCNFYVITFIFILRVIVEHMVYPVTLDVIFQIFSRVGKVMKIVTFTKNNTFQVKL